VLVEGMPVILLKVITKEPPKGIVEEPNSIPAGKLFVLIIVEVEL
jgi:hypothetical protein